MIGRISKIIVFGSIAFFAIAFFWKMFSPSECHTYAIELTNKIEKCGLPLNANYTNHKKACQRSIIDPSPLCVGEIKAMKCTDFRKEWPIPSCIKLEK